VSVKSWENQRVLITGASSGIDGARLSFHLVCPALIDLTSGFDGDDALANWYRSGSSH